MYTNKIAKVAIFHMGLPLRYLGHSFISQPLVEVKISDFDETRHKDSGARARTSQSYESKLERPLIVIMKLFAIPCLT